MTNIDSFKLFVRKNPNLITHVKMGKATWQQFYEMYDLYGEEDNIWKDYIIKNNDNEQRNSVRKNTSGYSLSNIIEMAKNIDTNKLQDGIVSIQKAISLFGNMLSKDKTDTNTYTPRPIYRRFED